MSASLEIKPGQSIELLKELHILTRDGKLNQDSRRKLKQVYHLYQFIEPLFIGASTTNTPLERPLTIRFRIGNVCRSGCRPKAYSEITAPPEVAISRASFVFDFG